MVRFIIYKFTDEGTLEIRFTFQYGQIYYAFPKNRKAFPKNIYIPIWLDLLFKKEYEANKSIIDLHSNMVRFIIDIDKYRNYVLVEFTFQYGQIYYRLGDTITSNA